MILEGLVTTLDENGEVRIAPMGPIVSPDWRTMVLRPFTTAHTFENLRRTGQGIFHVTDDVELIARSAIDRLSDRPQVRKAESVEGMILIDACRYYGFRVESMAEDESRATISCRIVERGFQREFFGFCRAKHAVIEAAILATRVHLSDTQNLTAELARLAPLVEKTGGESEQRAYALLTDYIMRVINSPRE